MEAVDRVTLEEATFFQKLHKSLLSSPIFSVEHIHRGRMSQVCAEDLVSPYERPAVGMELGGGYVKLGQELPLKACEGKPKLDLLEHGGVDEAEGGVVAPRRCRWAHREDKDARTLCHHALC